jgi:hypothetical protein
MPRRRAPDPPPATFTRRMIWGNRLGMVATLTAKRRTKHNALRPVALMTSLPTHHCRRSYISGHPSPTGCNDRPLRYRPSAITFSRQCMPPDGGRNRQCVSRKIERTIKQSAALRI